MAKPLEDTIKPKGDDEATDKDEISQLNSPELDPNTGKPTKEAISSFKQAHSISKRLYDKAKEGRIKTAAMIAEKYGGGTPFRGADLRATGQAWRNNFSTNPLASVVDRSTPQLTDPIKQAEFLTYSALPAERENAAEKTRKFRTRTTKLVRSWSGFVSMVGQIAQEDYLYGNAAPGWIDDDWRPKAFRYDEVFLPEGSGQHASQVPFIVFRQPMMLHTFLENKSDKDAAKDAGYDWDGCIKAVNECCGLGASADENALEQVDKVREGGTLNYTYDGETKIIWLFHLLIREYTGGVNMWTTSHKGHGIRKVAPLHESMEDGTSLFTLQEGNEKFYGSKGAGRLLTNLHIAIDRTRNLGSDQIYLSGLPILVADEGDFARIQPTVRHPFILVPAKAQIAKEQVSFDVDGFRYMISELTGIMNSIAGAFIPPHTESDQSGANTKIEAAQKAERELAVKNGVLGRFFGQYADLQSAMQRKIYKPENLKEGQRLYDENKEKQKKGMRVMAAKIFKWLKDVVTGLETKAVPTEESKVADADAVQCIVDLLTDGLTIEDIAELALSPSGNNVEEQPEEQDAKTVNFIETKQGHPMYNQREMNKLLATTVVGEDRANRILLPDQEDPNVEAVATRQQITEWLNMMDGEAMPVASTDAHNIHRKVLLPKLEPIIKTLSAAPTQELLPIAKLSLQHYSDHLAADTTMTPEAKKPEEQGIADWVSIVEGAEKHLANLAEQAAKAGVPGGAGALPPQVPGAPIQATGPNGELGGTGEDLEREKLRAEAALRVEDQNIEHRKLDIKERELDNKQETHAIDTSIGIAKETANKVADASREGLKDAQQELREQAAATDVNKPSI